tara:strand:- start:202 stop:579 length:378 start_codon:yes stop_codon:yes gene_type:complete
MHATKNTLKADIAYTHETCFQRFPFPQSVDKKVVEKIRETMDELNSYRNNLMKKNKYGITDLYNQYYDEPESKLSQIHSRLDQNVLKAYGWMEDDNVLENLLNLNLEISTKEKKNQNVVGPWAPT